MLSPFLIPSPHLTTISNSGERIAYLDVKCCCSHLFLRAWGLLAWRMIIKGQMYQTISPSGPNCMQLRPSPQLTRNGALPERHWKRTLPLFLLAQLTSPAPSSHHVKWRSTQRCHHVCVPSKTKVSYERERRLQWISLLQLHHVHSCCWRPRYLYSSCIACYRALTLPQNR